MRLAPHAYRELHWHTANEWSLVLQGSVRLHSIDDEGRKFIGDIQAGDVWFFPQGVPHSIQALDEGCEFLLIFDDGSFSEDSTFLASELFIRNPKEVVSKDFQTPSHLWITSRVVSCTYSMAIPHQPTSRRKIKLAPLVSVLIMAPTPIIGRSRNRIAYLAAA